MNIKVQLEQVLAQWKDISGLDFALLTPAGTLYMQTGKCLLPPTEEMKLFLAADCDCKAAASADMYKIILHDTPVYLLIVWNDSSPGKTIGELAVCQITSLLATSESRIDKNAFIQHYLMGDYTAQEVATHARRLHIRYDVPRSVFLVETKDTLSELTMTAIRHTFPFRSGDFVIQMNEKYVAVIRELAPGCTYEELEESAQTLVTMLNTEVMTSAWVAYGGIAEDLEQLPTAYEEARTALEVGRIFTPSHHTFGYRNLGIGHLIYQLPTDICEMFIREALNGGQIDELDEETLRTIEIFFNNNLNLSETARQLYLHRNTLVYRFEKLQKKFGLDIRTFEDAMTFKIAMMIVNYLKEKAPREFERR